jgi:RNA polymerase sigma-70 factor, ECF subfamily
MNRTSCAAGHSPARERFHPLVAFTSQVVGSLKEASMEEVTAAAAGRGELRLRESLGDLSDLLLVSKAQRGDARAFEALMRRYNRRLFRVARGVLREDSAAEDAVQEAYLSAFTHLGQYQPSGKFGAWLARITLNEALMIRRRTRADTVALAESSELPPQAEALAGGELAVTYDYDEVLHARQLLERAIDGLPEGFRLVFILRRVEQMSAAETAACLGINEVTVRTRLHRANRLLRTELSRRMQVEQPNLYDFGATRCDCIVDAVLLRLRELTLIKEQAQ